jgi:acylphosphatase
MTRNCFRYLIAGRVQGVFYRDTTRQKAQQLQITGWVRNLPDGRVEVMAQGTPENLDLFGQWLWQGPPLAQVTEVVTKPAKSTEDFRDFVIRQD